jgi:two-component system chemotaxis response regulator CheB
MVQIKVLVVDDSAFMRKVISDIINSDPVMQVVATARDGMDAVQKVHAYHPDVVTMDVEMPRMDGLSALEEIMKTHPVPVIMISSLTQTGQDATIRSLSLGAIDFVPKPSGHISLDMNQVKDDIISKIRIAARAKSVISQQVQQSYKKPGLPKLSGWRRLNKSPSRDRLNKMVLIGTSTGGPKALHQVLPNLPADLDAAVLIVQHMPAGFTRSLAERLNHLSAIKVKEAEHGELIQAGCAYIAPGNYHLQVQNQSAAQGFLIKLDQSPPRKGHRPSVDMMFESVAELRGVQIVGVIMTGMGDDGTSGLKRLKEKGSKVLAEDQSTCIVYGMPRAAVEAGVVDRVVPLHHIADEILKML